jgi:xanthine dehydrogenase accessory factor
LRDILSDLATWHQQGKQIAVATVIETWGASPRPVGSMLAVNTEGGITGSVSAGCVENAVIQEALASLQSGQSRLLSFGISKETALDVGLTCGGTLKVLVEPFAAYAGIFAQLRAHLEARAPLGVIGVLEGPPETHWQKLLVFADGRTEGTLELADQRAEGVKRVLERLAEGTGGVIELAGLRLFLDIFPRTPRLIIVGAVHIAEFLVPMATLAGFDITIVDPRSAFATPERFPKVSAIVQRWPAEALTALDLDEASYVAVLSHDPKLDDPALRVALASRAKYVGVLGSKRANAQRLDRLRENGLSDDQLARLHAPIGLPLGGRSAAEIAVSILAELVQARHQALQEP